MTRDKKKRRRKSRVRVRIPRRTEASIEAAAVRKIEERWPGVLIRKMNGGGNRNWPDRVLFFSVNFVLFVEFKRPGEELRPGQAWMKEQLEKKGFQVLVAEHVDTLMNQVAEMLLVASFGRG